MTDNVDVVQRMGSGDALLASVSDAASYADAVHQLLSVVRTQLGMQMAWLSQFVGDEQVLRFVDAEPGVTPPREGTRAPLGGSFCARVVDGRFPALIPDARAVPEAALLDITHELRIGAYVGVPMLDSSGAVSGMLCAIHETACPSLDERDIAALKLMAQVLNDLQRRAVSAAEQDDARQRLTEALRGVLAGKGRHAVLQPIVDLVTGRAVAAEGLTRFSVPGQERSPAQWFNDADRLDLRGDLELAAAGAVLDLLPDVPGDVAVTINLAPSTVVGGGLPALLEGRPLDRVVVEMTEHARVSDYDDLNATLQPYRVRGLQLAVDDAGAGYASLRHVLAVRPDLIKIDMALVRGCDQDVARRTLLSALADFADATESRLVAEGVETDDELRAVAGCGVHLAQGYLLARPSASPIWSGFPRV